MIHVKDHGAVGDGVADDTAALMAAIATNAPLDWGDAGDVYRVTAEITVAATAPVDWMSRGATIRCDAPAAVKNVVSVELNGHHITVAGRLTVDAARKAFSCLYVRNAGTPSDARLTDVVAVSAYRSSQAFAGGDGIHLRGAFRTATLDRPVVQNIAMAEGAGVQGSQGITGITVSALDAAHLPGDVLVLAPYVDGVLSEDVTSSGDQDGIRIMTANAPAGTPAPYETNFQIVGGTVRNTGGRSVKAQVEWGTVDGLKVFRDVARQAPPREIDFQKGGGAVTDVSVQYDGTGAGTVVCFGDGSMVGKTIPHGSVDGLKVLLSGGASIEQAVTLRDTSNVGVRMICRGLEVVGGPVGYLARIDATAGAVVRAVVADSIAELTGAAVLAYYGHPTSWTGDVVLSSIINTGPVVPLLARSAGGTGDPTIHTSALVGFDTYAPTVEQLDLTGLIAGWSDVEECSARKGGGTITYTFKLRGPSRSDVLPMMRLPEGWRPSSAAIIPLRTFYQTETVGDLFVSADGQVTAYRSASTTWWSYATVTVPA